MESTGWAAAGDPGARLIAEQARRTRDGRGAELTMDVSSDLTELGRTPVAVVCAGAKSILDIPRTLEYLETLGVLVVGYGTDSFPAFFTPQGRP